MKSKIILAVILFPIFLFAQNKGVTPITNTSTSNRAVIIGISDYQKNEISDLHYADRAKAYDQYLR